MTTDRLITLAELQASVLQPWFSAADAQSAAGELVATPRDAAARAILAALNAQGRHKGTVRVLCSTIELTRDTKNYLTAMLESNKLKSMLRRQNGGVFELIDGLTIECTDNEYRLGKDIITSIRLSLDAVVQTEFNVIDVARRVCHAIESYIEGRLDDAGRAWALDLVAKVCPGEDPEHIIAHYAKQLEEQRREDDARKQQTIYGGNAPGVANAYEPATPDTQKPGAPDTHTSQEYELEQAERREAAATRKPPQTIRGRHHSRFRRRSD